MAKELKDLNLVDNFLFGTIMSDEKTAPVLSQVILQTIFQREFKNLKVHAEHTIWPSSDKLHGIRMDAYIEENNTEVFSDSHGIYNIEPDKKVGLKNSLPRRSRFYHSKIDNTLLESGKDYLLLNDVWVIFITTYDPFEENRMVYTIKSHCVESPEMPYHDGAETLFLYTKGTEGNPPEGLRILMNYLNNTTPENAVTPELETIQKIVEQKKLDPKTKEAYMTLERILFDERREAAAEAAAEASLRIEAEKARADAAQERADRAERELSAIREELDRLKEQLAAYNT